ncbi:ABC transporter ATP-binding protein [Ramlibacter terrae]|uniref:ABC transporter ATP-binding protein n=1 Tax=Ramlibacter terrae TaxID=2732511 RepID=A0ABX6P207_9BURK|nr:ABC transporter ATP-binding protein [Ramlibacter terrae]
MYYGKSGRDFGTLLPVPGALAVGAQKLMPLVQQIYNGWSSALGSQASVDNVLDLLEFEPQPAVEGPGIAFRDEIRLEDVGFHYGGSAPAARVLEGVHLHIRRGEKVGIVGPTGSGKSTLVDLLMGLLSPTAGRFTVDGHEITPANAASWQRHIAHVPQSIYLSDATIAENIAFGLPPAKIDQARLQRAAATAQIHEHIRGLPDGYATVVGERGARLSGGQRQRIGIARALYKQADVLVLDEATSALDDDTEARLMDALIEVARETTVIMIAHRLTTMKRCDRIVHLERGRVQRLSTYGELMAKRAQAPAQAQPVS